MLGFLLFVFLTFFLIKKLNEVLGTRTGFYAGRPEGGAFENVIRESTVSETDKKLSKIKTICPSFDPDDFLDKARKAFEMIFTAYSEEDLKTLRTLLSPRIFQAFSMAIDDRKKRNETLEGVLVRFVNVEITGADVTDDGLFVDVKFETEQSNVLKSKEGTILEGNADFVENCSEIWSFSRKKTSADSRWYLYEIKSE
ncbi:MAG: Tim44/TimA family putative adaptor protein [Holosporaceae bacterium]|jgi:predicted lipid-binding transport protein (Tim44 family)|nr:Tim44/TimA family putative adaptor protein [Holosporaceae bacterium]